MSNSNFLTISSWLGEFYGIFVISDAIYGSNTVSFIRLDANSTSNGLQMEMSALKREWSG